MLIIDRFEDNKAVIEWENGIFTLPGNVLPVEAKEGDVIKIIVDRDETEKRKNEINELSDQLFE